MYDRALAAGSLILGGKRSPDIRLLISEAHERFGEPSVVVADRWKQDVLFDALEDCGLHPELVSRGMGWFHSSVDVDAARFLVGEERLFPVRHELWDWSMSKATTVTDPAGNYKLQKVAGDDLATATTLAAGLVRREGQRLADPPEVMSLCV